MTSLTWTSIQPTHLGLWKTGGAFCQFGAECRGGGYDSRIHCYHSDLTVEGPAPPRALHHQPGQSPHHDSWGAWRSLWGWFLLVFFPFSRSWRTVPSQYHLHLPLEHQHMAADAGPAHAGSFCLLRGSVARSLLSSSDKTMLRNPGMARFSSGVPKLRLVAKAIKLLQACIYKSVNTGLFLTSLVATSIAKFLLLLLDS